MHQQLHHGLVPQGQACQQHGALQNPQSPLRHLFHPILFPCTVAEHHIHEHTKKESPKKLGETLQRATVILLIYKKKKKAKFL